LSPLDDRKWQTYDLLSPRDALRYCPPGWLWLSYILFGIAFWTGAGFGIHALIGVL
jgi:hypothetical protein